MKSLFILKEEKRTQKQRGEVFFHRVKGSLHYNSLSLLLLEKFSEHKKLRSLFRAGSSEGEISDYYGNPWFLELLVKNKNQDAKMKILPLED